MNKEKSLRVRKLTYAALFLALALVLPFLTGQIPELGVMLCPMHIPVLICGFVCGWPWGMAVGFIAPVLRSFVFGMPRLYPMALSMMFELAVYGAASGWMYRLLPKKNWAIYITLLIAMVLGRMAAGLAMLVLLSVQGNAYTVSMFITGTVTSAIPGIILHIALIPLIVMALKRAKLILNR